MKFTIAAGEPLRHQCRALVAGCFEKEFDAPLLAGIDGALGGCLGALARDGEFTGKLNRTAMVHTLGRIAPDRLLLVGLGRKAEFTPDRMRQAAGTAVRALSGVGVKSFASVLQRAGGSGQEWLRAEAEGIMLGGYAFNRYKTEDDIPGAVEEVTLLSAGKAAIRPSGDVVEEARTLCEAVLLARELVDQPANVATPAFLAEKAVEVAGRYGFDCRVMERDEMERWLNKWINNYTIANPGELAGQQIISLLTWVWSDSSPEMQEFFELAKRMPGVALVSALKPAARGPGESDWPVYHLAAPHESTSVGGIRVHTFQLLDLALDLF